MASAVNVGSINLPKMMRQLSHRTSQVRDLTFMRDAVYDKEYKKYPANASSGTELSGPPVSFGYETSSTTDASFTKAQDSGSVTHRYVSSPEIVLPGLTMLQSPIKSRSGRLERIGHRISGSCIFHAPSLDYIKALDNFKDTKAFAELESYDKLYDMERVIFKPIDKTGDNNQTITISSDDAGYEIDRIQFKVKTADDISTITLNGYVGGAAKSLVWTAPADFTPTSFVTIDLPVRDIKAAETKEVYMDGEPQTFTANPVTLNINKLKGGATDYLSTLIIATSGSASVELKDIYLYRQAEWRIESIKDYRDEYMQIAAVRVRGDRASRRRTYG